jgi:glutamate-1-semialdehyde 2,1-aminomutase
MPDKWSRSREYMQRARQSLAGGVSSPFRAKAPIPLYLADACGSRIRDVDGNEYIDYSLAWGPLILGHRHPRLVETLRAQAERPHIYGAQHELEFHLAEMLQRHIACAERLAFTSSGSEAVQIALRLARAFTCRPLVVKFEGHYHGWMDSVLLSYKPDARELASSPPTHGIAGSLGQVENAADNLLIAPWNDLDAVERLFAEHGSEIAAVITEPVACNSGCLLPEAGYLEGLAAVARRHGALLIFDEVITGFRLSMGGAQAFYKVTPDLATFGKAIAGGLPLSVLAGRREILEMIAGGGVAFGGTFNGNPISLAAAATTIQELSQDAFSRDRLRHGFCAALQPARFAAQLSRHFAGRSRPVGQLPVGCACRGDQHPSGWPAVRLNSPFAAGRRRDCRRHGSSFPKPGKVAEPHPPTARFPVAGPDICCR